jgi:hypothetical protein
MFRLLFIHVRVSIGEWMITNIGIDNEEELTKMSLMIKPFLGLSRQGTILGRFIKREGWRDEVERAFL